MSRPSKTMKTGQCEAAVHDITKSRTYGVLATMVGLVMSGRADASRYMINVNWLLCILKDGGQTTAIERTKVSLQRQACINFGSRSSSHLLNNISTWPSHMGLTSPVAVQSALLRRSNVASGIIAGATRSKTSSEEQVNLRKEMRKTEFLQWLICL